MPDKANILVVGFGGIGTITAYNLEVGGQAKVTGVLRSNFSVVRDRGFNIWSCDHGQIDVWRPTTKPLGEPLLPTLRLPPPDEHQLTEIQVLQSIPAADPAAPFDYIVVTTKNIADIHPTVTTLIAPAVTASHTTIVLVQNGINIERPLIAAFPKNIVLSGVSRTNVTERIPGTIFHQDHDILLVGPFHSPELDPAVELAAAQDFVTRYSASGKVSCTLEPDVPFIRWRKLVGNASFNSLCAITSMDTSTLRLAGSPIEELLRPIMLEVMAIARAAGVELAEDQDVVAMGSDSIDGYFRPSMQQDMEKDNYIELEVIVGEPVREAHRLGVPAPTLNIVYSLLKALQMRTKFRKGHEKLPPNRNLVTTETAK